MAKSETKENVQANEGAAADKPVAEKPAPAAPVKKKFFMVTCNATTYLAHNPAVLELAEGENAWDKFMELNGISSCSHGHEIVELTAEQAAEQTAALAVAAAEREEKKKIKPIL